jgi:replication initiation protein RepC
VQDRSLAVLQALLSFYPSDELSDERGLVVFPVECQLVDSRAWHRRNDLAPASGALVDAGLIERRDSPNGKRYAHRGRGGEIEEAFGFSLAPLVARAAEFASLAQQVPLSEKLRFKRAKEALSLCRRDVRKLISAAMEEGADGDWAAIEACISRLIARLPRALLDGIRVDIVLEEMELLREEIINRWKFR